jgi:ADP-glucose pyrophosphorylase
VNIEPGARIKRAIIDTEVRIRSGVSIGYDLEADARRAAKYRIKA